MLRLFKQLWPAAQGYRRLPTLVLINGLAEQGESWYCNRDAWQRHFEVLMPGILVYDGPVIQERMQSGQRITVDFLTDRLTEYLDRFVQAPPYHLVASSLGGQIAVEYVHRHPEHVGRVALLCPSGFGGDERLPIAEGARNNNSQGLVESVFFDRRFAIPGVVNYFERKFASRPWRKALFQTVRGTKRHNVQARLPELKRPTLIVCGEDDKIVDPQLVKSAVAGLPNFQYVSIPRCGHAPQLERPQVVNKLISDFLLAEPPAAVPSPSYRQLASAVAEDSDEPETAEAYGR